MYFRKKSLLKIIVNESILKFYTERKLINQIFFNKSGKALKSAPSSKAPKKSTQR